jgi:hypothetical protein
MPAEWLVSASAAVVQGALALQTSCLRVRFAIEQQVDVIMQCS